MNFIDEYARVLELQNAGFVCPYGRSGSGHFLSCKLLAGAREQSTTVHNNPPVDGIIVNSNGQPELTPADRTLLKDFGIRW